MLGKLIEQYDGRKARLEKHNSKKGFEKNEHACSVEFFWFQITLPVFV